MIDINLQTKIADLLTAYPQLEDKLIGISPVFAKLKNPILRRTVARVTSVQQAATIANMPQANSDHPKTDGVLSLTQLFPLRKW